MKNYKLARFPIATLLLVLASGCVDQKTPQGALGLAYKKAENYDYKGFTSLLTGQATHDWGNPTAFSRLHDLLPWDHSDFVTRPPELKNQDGDTRTYEVEVAKYGRNFLKTEVVCQGDSPKTTLCKISDVQLDLQDEAYGNAAISVGISIGGISTSTDLIDHSQVLRTISFNLNGSAMNFDCVRQIAAIDGSVSHSIRAYLKDGSSSSTPISSLGDHALDQKIMLFCSGSGLTSTQTSSMIGPLSENLEELSAEPGNARIQARVDKIVNGLVRE